MLNKLRHSVSWWCSLRHGIFIFVVKIGVMVIFDDPSAIFILVIETISSMVYLFDLCCSVGHNS